MEIESKFQIPNATLFEHLSSLSQMAGYEFKTPATKIIVDTYLDTAEGHIYQAGFACRVRHNTSKNMWMASLKGLGGAQGAIHSRAEYETSIKANAHPRDWPASQARELALQLSNNHPLVPVLTLYQTRHVRQIEGNGRPVGELSLDEVTYQGDGLQASAYELEIELGATGSLDDLHALHNFLIPLGLIPEPTSKFERGMALNRKG
jgi:inorganic triphosphatase YgiF